MQHYGASYGFGLALVMARALRESGADGSRAVAAGILIDAPVPAILALRLQTLEPKGLPTIDQKPVRIPLLAVLAIEAILGSSQPDAHAQRPGGQRPPVSWVNPDLPNGAGLTHRVLASKAMGHDVGYVVWTPADLVQRHHRYRLCKEIRDRHCERARAQREGG